MVRGYNKEHDVHYLIQYYSREGYRDMMEWEWREFVHIDEWHYLPQHPDPIVLEVAERLNDGQPNNST